MTGSGVVGTYHQRIITLHHISRASAVLASKGPADTCR